MCERAGDKWMGGEGRCGRGASEGRWEKGWWGRANGGGEQMVGERHRSIILHLGKPFRRRGHPHCRHKHKAVHSLRVSLRICHGKVATKRMAQEHLEGEGVGGGGGGQ